MEPSIIAARFVARFDFHCCGDVNKTISFYYPLSHSLTISDEETPDHDRMVMGTVCYVLSLHKDETFEAVRRTCIVCDGPTDNVCQSYQISGSRQEAVVLVHVLPVCNNEACVTKAKNDLEYAADNSEEAAGKPAGERTWCQTCFKHDVPMLKCGACEVVNYCSKDCQKCDWREHKTKCAALKKTESDKKKSTGKHSVENPATGKPSTGEPRTGESGTGESRIGESHTAESSSGEKMVSEQGAAEQSLGAKITG